MTYGYTLARNWIGLTGLVLAIAGCPAGDDGDTGATTVDMPTTAVGSTTDEATTTSGTTESPTTAPADESSSGGGVTCDPPCTADQECIGGTCFDMGGETTTGDPPAECGLAVQLMFPNPACGPCAAGSCCDALQACFGDETTMMETECLQLNNCIAMSCATAMTLPDLQMCVTESCGDFEASLNTWLGYQSCLGMNCMAECS